MDNNIDTVIGANVSIKGNLFNKGSIHVNGNVEGEIKSDENIIVGETASIKGPVIAKVIVISGEVNGLVQAHEKLEINQNGKVYGDIDTKTLIIKEGALFVGQSMMQSQSAPNHATVSKSPEVAKSEPIADTASNSKDKMGFFGKK